jgi:pyruvate/2-oxoglutarate dehydrogenase complex dihydrolipoamide dehydrogenase (E3) component
MRALARCHAVGSVCGVSRAWRSSGGSDHFDLVVVGGGTGGLVSALVAAGLGARVALVEADRLGGDCLWTGCVPSKSLLAAADLAHRIRHADDVGLVPSEPLIEFTRVMDHVRRTQQAIEPHDSPARLERAGITVVSGHGRFSEPGVIDAGDRRLRYRKAIIASGSRPLLPRIADLAEVNPLTSDSVWQLTSLPRSLAILGGGAVGCELALAFSRLGSQVSLIELDEHLLPREEPRAGRLVADRLAAEGVAVLCRTEVRSVTGSESGGELEVQPSGAAPAIAFDRLLVAVGRSPRTEKLGLEQVGARTDASGFVLVDGRLRTTAAHVYAVGDVTGAMAFTHVAAYQARVAAVNALFGARRKVDYAAVPRVAFTDPEVAAVGLTQAEAASRWQRPKVVSFEYEELDRAIIDGQPYGFVTLVGDRRGRLVGATIAAPGGSEAIAELAAWIGVGAKIDRVSQSVHAYPTLSEGPSRGANAYVRERYARPGVRLASRAALRILNRVDRAR